MRCKSASVLLLNTTMHNKSVIISVYQIVVNNLHNVSVVIELLHCESPLAANFDGPSHLCPCTSGL